MPKGEESIGQDIWFIIKSIIAIFVIFFLIIPFLSALQS